MKKIGVESVYPNLAEEMKRRGYSINAVAALLNICETSVKNKLKGTQGFKLQEALDIQEKICPDLELAYIFHKKTE